jgi:hypothetical protein
MPADPPGEPDGQQDVLIEFVVQGGFVKVTAIHAGSGLEASIVGPASAPRATLQAAAMRKLSYLQSQRKCAT